MKSKDFEWLTDEFMLYCRTFQLSGNVCWYIGVSKTRIFPR